MSHDTLSDFVEVTATKLGVPGVAVEVWADAVRRYVPELRLPDEQAAAEVTVLNLLNHTAGLNWRISVDTGDGDDPWLDMWRRWPSWS